MMKFFQKLGKSLMLPVCVLPICGILMGVGYMLCPNAIQGGSISGTAQTIGYLLVKAGAAAIDNMSILFVIGVAVGMSDDGNGAAALSGIVSWLVITTLLSTGVMSVVYQDLKADSSAYLAFSKIQNPTIGMLSGLIGAGCYNRFRSTRLPDFLAFFSGRRSVSIVTMVVSLLAAAVLALIWPVCFGAMVSFGRWVASLGGLGCGLYAFLNRLLIPTGMHHALNNVFWFDTIGLGDLTNYWKGKTSQDVGWSLGMYMSGFFPCMMGGVPGAALAIYHCAKNKKKALGVLASTAFCALLCGLTEPFEFSFMFMCFPLYVVYSVLYGLFSIITYYVGFRAGFSFSAGIIDLVFSSSLPAAQNTWMIIPLALLAFAVFYLAFRFMIKKFNIPTIGREDDADDAPETVIPKEGSPVSEEADELAMARGLLKAVGGKGNVLSTDCCATRLRLELKDSSLVDEKLAVDCGAIGVMLPDKASCQIVIGTTVQQMLEAFRQAMQEEPQEQSQESKEAAGEKKTVPELTGPVTPHGEMLCVPLKTAEKADEKAGKAGAEGPALPIECGEDGELSFVYTVVDPAGIHARPAAQIVNIVKECGVDVTVETGGKEAAGSSPVKLMGLGIRCGSLIRVKIKGDPQAAKEAAARLSVYISKNL